MPNQIVMVIRCPIKLEVSCKLDLYGLYRTRSPPGPRLPRRIENAHLRNYYNIQGRISMSIFFLIEIIQLWIELSSPACDIQKHWSALSTLLGFISRVYRDLPHGKTWLWGWLSPIVQYIYIYIYIYKQCFQLSWNLLSSRYPTLNWLCVKC